MADLYYKLSTIRRRKAQLHSSLQLRGLFTVAERSALAPTAHVVVRSCRNFQKHCSGSMPEGRCNNHGVREFKYRAN
jgi:hypothetical protein